MSGRKIKLYSSKNEAAMIQHHRQDLLAMVSTDDLDAADACVQAIITHSRNMERNAVIDFLRRIARKCRIFDTQLPDACCVEEMIRALKGRGGYKR